MQAVMERNSPLEASMMNLEYIDLFVTSTTNKALIYALAILVNLDYFVGRDSIPPMLINYVFDFVTKNPHLRRESVAQAGFVIQPRCLMRGLQIPSEPTAQAGFVILPR